jgi:hypothetical protein
MVRWADQCIYDHEEAQNSCTTNCRTKLDGTSVGQNLYISANTAESDQAALTAAFTAEATSPVKAFTPVLVLVLVLVPLLVLVFKTCPCPGLV